MKHPIDYDDWLGYLDGDLDQMRTARVREHIEHCSECRSTWNELLEATAAMRSAALEYAAMHAVGEFEVRSGRERVLARIRTLESRSTLESVAAGELTVGRLRKLQHVVAPICGARTAFRLIVAATRRTPAPQGMAEWRVFLEQLTDLTSALCGRSTARLVWEIGNSLP